MWHIYESWKNRGLGPAKCIQTTEKPLQLEAAKMLKAENKIILVTLQKNLQNRWKSNLFMPILVSRILLSFFFTLFWDDYMVETSASLARNPWVSVTKMFLLPSHCKANLRQRWWWKPHHGSLLASGNDCYIAIENGPERNRCHDLASGND